jgi:hypothetical protein
MGRAAPLPDSEMTAFSDFVMPLAYPPNPQRNLDNTLPDPNDRPSPAAGEQIYLNTPIVASGNACVTCHATPPGTNRTMVSRNTLGISQDMKVPQLRNLYKKTGFTDAVGAASMRGFGYGHDGGIDNLFHLLQSPRFLFDPDSALGNPARRALAAFLLAYPTGTHPAVGVQVTFDGTPNPAGVARVDTLRGLVVAGEIDLIAKGRIGVQPRGWLYLGGDAWQPDKPSEADITTQDLLALAGDAGSAVTVTGVPLGSGQRMGIDRDRDTFLDGEELDAGSDPGDPQSTPLSVGVENGDARLRTALERVSPNPAHANVDIRFALARAGRVDVTVFDVLGREVRALARSDFRPGRWSLVWDGRRNDGGVAGAGVYFVRLHSGASHSTRTLVRLR